MYQGSKKERCMIRARYFSEKKIFLLRDIPCMCLCALPVGRRRNNNSHHHFDDDDRLASNNVAPKQQLSVPAD